MNVHALRGKIWLLVLAGAVAISLCAACSVGSIVYLKASSKSALVVGKWEDATGMMNAPGQLYMEFHADGTGKIYTLLNVVAPTDFRWRIEGGTEAPVLVMAHGRFWPEPNMDAQFARLHIHRDGDTLALGPLMKLKKMH